MGKVDLSPSGGFSSRCSPWMLTHHASLRLLFVSRARSRVPPKSSHYLRTCWGEYFGGNTPVGEDLERARNRGTEGTLGTQDNLVARCTGSTDPGVEVAHNTPR